MYLIDCSLFALHLSLLLTMRDVRVRDVRMRDAETEDWYEYGHEPTTHTLIPFCSSFS